MNEEKNGEGNKDTEEEKTEEKGEKYRLYIWLILLSH